MRQIVHADILTVLEVTSSAGQYRRSAPDRKTGCAKADCHGRPKCPLGEGWELIGTCIKVLWKILSKLWKIRIVKFTGRSILYMG